MLILRCDVEGCPSQVELGAVAAGVPPDWAGIELTETEEPQEPTVEAMSFEMDHPQLPGETLKIRGVTSKRDGGPRGLPELSPYTRPRRYVVCPLHALPVGPRAPVKLDVCETCGVRRADHGTVAGAAGHNFRGLGE